MLIDKIYLKQIILEEIENFSIDQLSKQMMTMMQNNFDDIKIAGSKGLQKANQNKQEVIDPLTITLIYSGIIAAIPAILKTIGWVQKKRGKLDSAEQFKEWHDKWHHSWLNVLKKALSFATLGKFTKLPEDKQNKIAERFYLVIIAYLFGESILSLIVHYNWLAPIEAILGSIKGGELVIALTNYIKSLAA